MGRVAALMRILILSRNRRLYSTRRLLEAGRERGHGTQVLDYLRVQLELSERGSEVWYQGRPIAGYDAVIPRIGASRTFFGTAVVRHFEAGGIHTVNSAQAIRQSRDKLMASQLLSGAKIALPTTVFAHSSRNIDSLIDSVGGPPVVIKLTEGTQGTGVILAETRDAAESVISAFRMLDAQMLVQAYVAEAKGADIRALVVGGQVIAAMMRRARPGEFRANLHRGAIAKSTELSAEEQRVAVKAAAVMGLNVAGVDFLRGKNGPLLLEVNSSPGLEGIELATGVDVAGAIIEHIEKTAPNGAPGDAAEDSDQ